MLLKVDVIGNLKFMPKKIYILIVFLIAFGFFNNTLTASVLNPDVTFIILLIWGIYGWILYAKYRNNPLNKWKNKRIFYWLMGIMLLSTLVPYFTYQQPIIDTMISQRYNYAIVYLLIFLRIFPTENDFLYAIRICAYLSLLCWILSIFYPSLFVDSKDLMDTLDARRESTDIGFAAPGLILAVFYLFIKTQKLFNHPTTKDVLIASLFMLYIIAVQNRSTIIGTLPFFIWGIIRMKTPKKKQLLFVCSILIFLIIPFVSYIYDSLLRETQLQLEDTNYNRWQALSLYLVEMKSDWFSIVLGNGVWSKTGEYLSLMLRSQFERGTYISDIGWLGTYFYYGIFPILILLYFAVKAVITKIIPLYLKYFSLWLIFVPTIHIFLILHWSSAIEFSFYFYLIMYYSSYKKYCN